MHICAENQMQQCIAACLDCYRSCEQTMVHCLHEGGPHTDPDHLSLMTDCAKICATAADFMLRGSHRHAQLCAICAEICDQCATDCDKMADDPHMRACADACRTCAQSCHQMSGQPA